MTRRGFLAATGSTMAAAAAPRALAGPTGAARDTLLLIDLRGGLDGLAACVPTFEGGPLATLRPGLLVPTSPAAGAVDLDGAYALHPALAPLEPLYRDGELAIVHAVGSLDPTRSHFAARRAIDAGVVGGAVQGTSTGWVARALSGTREQAALAPRGVALGAVLPRSLAGGPRVLPIPDPASFTDYGDTNTSARRRAALLDMHGGALPGAPDGAAPGTPRALVAASGITTLGAFSALDAVEFDRSPPASAAYPPSLLGGKLFDAASLIRADIGTEVIHIVTGDWDDHDDMGPVSGGLAARLDDLARGLAAFRADLGSSLQRTTVVVSSEFGRRADENGSRGTDHGRGGVAMVLGGATLGGRVVTSWPGLGPADLDGGALRVTTDLRDVFAEVLVRRLGVHDVSGVFPGHVATSLGLVG